MFRPCKSYRSVPGDRLASVMKPGRSLHKVILSPLFGWPGASSMSWTPAAQAFLGTWLMRRAFRSLITPISPMSLIACPLVLT